MSCGTNEPLAVSYARHTDRFQVMEVMRRRECRRVKYRYKHLMKI